MLEKFKTGSRKILATISRVEEIYSEYKGESKKEKVLEYLGKINLPGILNAPVIKNLVISFLIDFTVLILNETGVFTKK